MKKKTKKPRVDLGKKMTKLAKEIAVLREAYQTVRAAYETSIWEDFKTKWTGKYFKYEIGGPDLVRCGKVIGPEMSEGREWLAVLEISITPEYGWVELQKMHWDIARFEHYKAEELDRVETGKLMDSLRKHLNQNLETMGMALQ